LILLFNLPFAVSPHMIVLPGFATLVIVYFENCSKHLLLCVTMHLFDTSLMAM
jgi:hypothetical protein